MTVDVEPRPAAAPSPQRRGLRRVAVVLIGLLVAGGGLLGLADYYISTVPEPSPIRANHPIVMDELPGVVTYAFVAAIDPDFYSVSDGNMFTTSLITRRYVLLASGDTDADESSWRIRIMAGKFEEKYSGTEILGFYLAGADFGRGTVGLVDAAQAYFGKEPRQLTVAEAVLLAVQLHPDRPQPEEGWSRILDVMVQQGRLSQAERAALIFPHVKGS
ncbi:transglycosylase domain-containing protein [Catellatospora sp. TT07R-123]|uniref:transglycosylase domain-containing protein n=1 Tax=Catellatospora sp. TT07R-123 TaxID=2733863 RepID=UPI001BB41469|nr:transglycosylase domain-containing protein [Catellatospora sp. TT07R-123]